MKSEADMQSEGRVIARAIDNYTPLVNTPKEAQPAPNQKTPRWHKMNDNICSLSHTANRTKNRHSNLEHISNRLSSLQNTLSTYLNGRIHLTFTKENEKLKVQEQWAMKTRLPWTEKNTSSHQTKSANPRKQQKNKATSSSKVATHDSTKVMSELRNSHWSQCKQFSRVELSKLRFRILTRGEKPVNMVKWMALDIQETILIIQNEWEIQPAQNKIYIRQVKAWRSFSTTTKENKHDKTASPTYGKRSTTSKPSKV